LANTTATATLRSALKDLKALGCLTDPTFDKLNERKVVEVLLDTFPQAHLNVCRTAIAGGSAINCDFYTASSSDYDSTQHHYRIVLRESVKDPYFTMHLDEVVWGDGSDPSDWKRRDEARATSLTDVIGWTSWVIHQVPPCIEHLAAPPKHRMPNLQRLCWYHGPIPNPPFVKLTLGTAVYEESPTTRWSIRFPRPWRALRPGAYIHLLPDPTGKRGRGMGLIPEAIASTVRDIEDKAIEILRAIGKEPVTATRRGWNNGPLTTRTPITEAIGDVLQDYMSKYLRKPEIIYMHPFLAYRLINEPVPRILPDSPGRGGNPPFTAFGVKVIESDAATDGTLILVGNNQEHIERIELADYLPKSGPSLTNPKPPSTK